MKLRLVDDWREVVSHSLSLWLQIVGLFVLILPELRYALWARDTDPFMLWWAGVLLLLAGVAGRLLEQPRARWIERLRIAAVALLVLALSIIAARADPASEAQTLELAVPFVAGHEGERLVAYIPMAGDVPTICYGETRDVHLGMTATHAQCLAWLRARVAEFRTGLHRYFLPDTLALRLPPKRDAAFTDLGYNCGIPSIGRSTSVARLNAGDIRGACQAMTWWNKLGQRVIRGLVARRSDDLAYCLADLR